MLIYEATTNLNGTCEPLPRPTHPTSLQNYFRSSTYQSWIIHKSINLFFLLLICPCRLVYHKEEMVIKQVITRCKTDPLVYLGLKSDIYPNLQEVSLKAMSHLREIVRLSCPSHKVDKLGSCEFSEHPFSSSISSSRQMECLVSFQCKCSCCSPITRSPRPTSPCRYPISLSTSRSKLKVPTKWYFLVWLQRSRRTDSDSDVRVRHVRHIRADRRVLQHAGLYVWKVSIHVSLFKFQLPFVFRVVSCSYDKTCRINVISCKISYLVDYMKYVI